MLPFIALLLSGSCITVFCSIISNYAVKNHGRFPCFQSIIKYWTDNSYFLCILSLNVFKSAFENYHIYPLSNACQMYWSLKKKVDATEWVDTYFGIPKNKRCKWTSVRYINLKILNTLEIYFKNSLRMHTHRTTQDK